MNFYYECDFCKALYEDKDKLTLIRVNNIGENSVTYGAVWNGTYLALCTDCLAYRKDIHLWDKD